MGLGLGLYKKTLGTIINLVIYLLTICPITLLISKSHISDMYVYINR